MTSRPSPGRGSTRAPCRSRDVEQPVTAESHVVETVDGSVGTVPRSAIFSMTVGSARLTLNTAASRLKVVDTYNHVFVGSTAKPFVSSRCAHCVSGSIGFSTGIFVMYMSVPMPLMGLSAIEGPTVPKSRLTYTFPALIEDESVVCGKALGIGRSLAGLQIDLLDRSVGGSRCAASAPATSIVRVERVTAKPEAADRTEAVGHGGHASIGRQAADLGSEAQQQAALVVGLEVLDQPEAGCDGSHGPRFAGVPAGRDRQGNDDESNRERQDLQTHPDGSPMDRQLKIPLLVERRRGGAEETALQRARRVARRDRLIRRDDRPLDPALVLGVVVHGHRRRLVMRRRVAPDLLQDRRRVDLDQDPMTRPEDVTEREDLDLVVR